MQAQKILEILMQY